MVRLATLGGGRPRRPARLRAVLAVLVVSPSRAFAIDPDWDTVEKIFGRPPKVQPDGVRRFGWPRTDLHVTRDGVALALDIYRRDIDRVMGLCGWSRLSQVDRTVLNRAGQARS